MDELDFFKKHWKENNNFPNINTTEIRQMLYKSSSSIVKWIFVACCIELLVGLLLPFILPADLYEDKTQILFFDVIYWIFNIVFYSIIVYFIYRFYTLFIKIKNNTNTKSLLENIIAVRHNADRYIQFNLLCINISFTLVFLEMLTAEYLESHSWNMIVFVLLLGGITILISIYIFKKLLKLYYKLVFGILLKKLNNNYEELIKLEEED